MLKKWLQVILILACTVWTGGCTDGGDVAVQRQQQDENDGEQHTDDGTIMTTSDEAAADTEETIYVEDHLGSLSNDELLRIVSERGFDMEPRADGGPFRREDYLEAARRCLTIEGEIDAILNENPELAAELEMEIERMKREKERLIGERDEILREKEKLEEKLVEMGVDVKALVPPDDGDDTVRMDSMQSLLVDSLKTLIRQVRRDFERLIELTKGMTKFLLQFWNLVQPKLMMVVRRLHERIRRILLSRGGDND